MRCFLILLVLVFTVGCTRTVKNVVEKTDSVTSVHNEVSRDTLFISKTDTFKILRTDTVYKTKIQRDSVFVRDSVYVKEKDGIISYYKEKWNTKIVTLHDTLYRSKTDTVYRLRTDTVYLKASYTSSDSLSKASEERKEKVKKAPLNYMYIVLIGGIITAIISIFIFKNKV